MAGWSPVFKDYVVQVVDTDGRRSRQDFWLAMHPNLETRSQYGDAILNGLEIFKLNNSDGSLAGRNPDSPSIAPPPYRASGDSRGFGFLSLERDDEADAAIRALDKTEWNGRIVLVEKSKSH
ncbi:hypothetical protein RJ639_041024 [Escallonia herrerae]|uniref:RRM domain-containing protein n=1 Tax=Escallonia herrerae TaxID=1293975 RepID=A0AA89BA16_9ASTE|nr:hypothetical protein RJ639_041024 [Escallonia herrerae]